MRPALKIWMALCLLLPGARGRAASIDRHALVTRHTPVLHQFDAWNPFSVGNGDFAFTADATGLQTLDGAFTNTVPLATLSQWGWHSFPNPNGWSIDQYPFKEFDVFGRKVGYADVPGNHPTAEAAWLRENPHRLDLGRIAFILTKADGSAARTNDLTAISQTLDLWNGILLSRFELEGAPVEVKTVCHPDLDLVAVRVVSPLLQTGRVKIALRFPYGTPATVTADWTRPEAHETVFRPTGAGTAEFDRQLDQDIYHAAARWSGGELARTAKHEFVLTPSAGADALEFVCAFAPKAPPRRLPDFARTQKAAARHWNEFWRDGGAIDLSSSKDPRWQELERRIVLSEYLTAIQCDGATPPQETGLTCNSWGGKFHLEMHLWHAAHFALWGRLPLLEKSLGYYRSILPRAQNTARRQGYAGARWPKMTDPSGQESPSPVGPFLIWQEPHPIFYAELCYRQHPDRATLEKYGEIVRQTAEFMASYPAWETNRCVLGPVLQCAQEIFPKEHTLNPTFELTYWRWGLETAQQWRLRLGLAREPDWDRVLQHLARPALEDAKYLFAETAAGTYTENKWNSDHPSVTAALGLLPGPGIDRETMRRTFHWIWDNWDWERTWGWDYGMLAMCAARLGEPGKAVDALLLDAPKNHYALNGHNYQRPGLTVYLPGNGSLLYAAAMMAAGWDGGPGQPAPGFPADGQWTVRCEGLQRAP
jgi:protein-glucosylgalactosylhydroxylysine glucosidase